MGKDKEDGKMTAAEMTPVYRLKKKLMRAIYGIDVQEITKDMVR